MRHLNEEFYFCGRHSWKMVPGGLKLTRSPHSPVSTRGFHTEESIHFCCRHELGDYGATGDSIQKRNSIALNRVDRSLCRRKGIRER